ncbi:MAG: hypothetical protein AAF327_12475 [Cyanobacteria bacterium P01_A01_bin.37]
MGVSSVIPNCSAGQLDQTTQIYAIDKECIETTEEHSVVTRKESMAYSRYAAEVQETRNGSSVSDTYLDIIKAKIQILRRPRSGQRRICKVTFNYG